MTKPALVYAGHSYHKLTSSTQFLLDLLGPHYQVSVVWDEGWKPSGEPLRAKQINALEPEVVLFFQTLPALKELRQIRCRRLFIVPMHDHVMGNPQEIWSQVRGSGLRALNFCRATNAIFLGLGYESLCVQYWQPPLVRALENRNGIKLFFWPRRHEISWQTLKALLGPARPERIVMRVAADPEQEIAMPSREEIAEYRIEIVHGWLEKQRYLELLSACNLFMAPRVHEGIGQSFLEAMSYGLVVIAPNAPTMNEYIEHGVTGYLYDYAAPAPIDFSSLESVRAHLLARVHTGHATWQSQQASLLAYLASAPTKGQDMMWKLRRLLGR